MIDFAEFQKYSLFGGFQPEDIELIRPLLRTMRLKGGSAIIRENESNDAIYFILEGRVSVTRASLSIIELGEGDCFGEMEMLDVMPAAATVRAVGSVGLAAFDRGALHRLYKLDSKLFGLFMMNLARDLSRRLRRMDEKACADAPAAPTAPELAPAV